MSEEHLKVFHNNWTHCCKPLLCNSRIQTFPLLHNSGSSYYIFESMVCGQCWKTMLCNNDLGLHLCNKDLRCSSKLGSCQCNKDPCDMPLITPLERQFTQKSTHFKCYFVSSFHKKILISTAIFNHIFRMRHSDSSVLWILTENNILLHWSAPVFSHFHITRSPCNLFLCFVPFPERECSFRLYNGMIYVNIFICLFIYSFTTKAMYIMFILYDFTSASCNCLTYINTDSFCSHS